MQRVWASTEKAAKRMKREPVSLLGCTRQVLAVNLILHHASVTAVQGHFYKLGLTASLRLARLAVKLIGSWLPVVFASQQGIRNVKMK